MEQDGATPTPGKYENGVHRVTFPLFGREESDVWLRADARIRCPSSRRIERKETLKKTGSFFPLVSPGPAAPGPPVRTPLRASETFDRILNFFAGHAAAAATLTKINRRLAWTITLCLVEDRDAGDTVSSRTLIAPRD